jgi:N-acetylglutamate synthase-like GNAT family acetyltransferase
MTADNCRISSDPIHMDVSAIHAYLTRSYWAQGIPYETVAKSIECSLCFGVFQGNRQIGFARVITDKATYAYLCDVYILEEYRGSGLARRLMETVSGHPDLQNLRRFTLVTRDAHGLYEKFGFKSLDKPNLHMEIFHSNIYQNT